MTPLKRPMEYRSLAAPRENFSWLVEPPLASSSQLLADNQERLAHGRVGQSASALGSLPLAELRTAAQAQLTSAALEFTRQYRSVEAPARSGPLIVSGHQPELFHPGVWAKNALIHQLAALHQGTAVNWIIDSDQCKSTAIRCLTGPLEQLSQVSILFDQPTVGMPYEERPIVDWSTLKSFPAKVGQALSQHLANPMVHEFWPLILDRARATSRIGLAISQARHLWEARFGWQTLELPLSHVARLPAYQMLVLQLLRQAPQLWQSYNAALAEYRSVNQMRSLTHPMPDLAKEGDWHEVPFWLWRADQPLRQRVFVKVANGGRLEVRSGPTLVGSIPGDATGAKNGDDLAADADHAAALAQLAAWERAGIKLRTRALATTLIARVLFADLFVHGIGGAKYDQVTDRIIEELFGIPAPSFVVCTGTLRLPLALAEVPWDRVKGARHQMRDLQFHPERWMPETAATSARNQNLITQKQAWIRTPQTRENARERCRAIRAANFGLVESLSNQQAELERAAAQLHMQWQNQRLGLSREFAFCLFDNATLATFFGQIPAN